MYEFAKLAGYLLSPLTLALSLWVVAGLLLALRWRATALALAVVAVAWLWLASTPIVGKAMLAHLESRYPALAVNATPRADAIVVLGGALAGSRLPRRPTFRMSTGVGRIWHAAELFRAGKAKWVVIAAGGEPEVEGQRPEAESIAEMLRILGVPDSAIRLETESRNTMENARLSRPVIESLGAQQVLLVTSAFHMPRAMKTFELIWKGAGISLVAASADVQVLELRNSPKMWLPSLSALEDVSKALKEFAGIAALAIIGPETFTM